MFRPEYDPDLFYHWHTIPVRFRDLDTLNHVNNAVFNTFYEEARIHFVHQIPEFASAFAEGMSFVLVKCTIEYLKPVLYPSEVLIGSSGLSIGNTSMEAFQAIYDSKTKQLLSIATTKGVWFNTKTQRPTRVPEIANSDKMMIRLDDNG